jgi:hypothetical protein
MPRAFALCLLAAAGLSGAPAAAQGPTLDWVLPSATEVGAGWDVVKEAPSDPKGDPDLVRWGVRAQRARHYTRDVYGAVQVCSIEVWAFEGPGLAHAAYQGISYPEWKFALEGSLLLMVRGLTHPRGAPPRRGVFDACGRLGERVRARAARIAGGAAVPPP